MNYPNVIAKRIDIEGIPSILMRPKNRQEKYPTVIFYHGWTSNKDTQSFRGFILASLGYQVLLPDAIYHGERGRIDYGAKENAGVFWEVVLKNLEESDYLIDGLVRYYDADERRIALSGHSMGGFTSIGIFAKNKLPRTLVVLNGSGNWEKSNDIFIEILGIERTDRFNELQKRVIELDPFKKLDDLKDRPILILHGEDDSVVDIGPQREFYEVLKKRFKRQDLIMMSTYKQLNHYVTTNMMEEMGSWLEKYL